MCFDFHTPRPAEDALVSSPVRPERGLWSLEFHPWRLPESFLPPEEAFYRDLRQADALGEIGLDRLRGPALPVQRRFFAVLLEAAGNAGKPVVIHAVRCGFELDAALKNFPGRVLIHGFRGGERRLREHLDAGRFVSFAPGAWKKCTAVLAERGLRNIGLESDDGTEDIAAIYAQAERETGIPDWRERCRGNFMQFIGRS